MPDPRAESPKGLEEEIDVFEDTRVEQALSAAAQALWAGLPGEMKDRIFRRDFTQDDGLEQLYEIFLDLIGEEEWVDTFILQQPGSTSSR